MNKLRYPILGNCRFVLYLACATCAIVFSIITKLLSICQSKPKMKKEGTHSCPSHKSNLSKTERKKWLVPRNHILSLKQLRFNHPTDSQKTDCEAWVIAYCCPVQVLTMTWTRRHGGHRKTEPKVQYCRLTRKTVLTERGISKRHWPLDRLSCCQQK